MFTWTITDTRRFTGLVLTVRTNAPFVRIELKRYFSAKGQLVCTPGVPASPLFLRQIEPAGTRDIIFEDETLGKQAESATAKYIFVGFSTFTMR